MARFKSETEMKVCEAFAKAKGVPLATVKLNMSLGSIYVNEILSYLPSMNFDSVTPRTQLGELVELLDRVKTGGGHDDSIAN